jgi:hypothetical protein
MARANRIRVKKERDKIRITTYTPGARGSRRILGSILVGPEEVNAKLSDPAVLAELGIATEGDA